MSSDRPTDKPDLTPGDVRMNYLQRRRQKIVDEIERNRRGEYTVPTWVLAAILVAIIVAFAVMIYFA